MTPLHVRSGLDAMLEKLRGRYDLFQLIRESHLRWTSSTDDVEIREIHRTLAALFVSIMEQYVLLMDALQNRR